MSSKYPGGFITKNYVAPTPAAAPGIWTLDQQLQAQKTGTWPFGGPFNYIEDVFSTWLYTGNGTSQTITNGIDLAGKGGLVWIKDRTDTPFHVLTDTARGVNSQLYSNSTSNANNNTLGVTAFNSTGFNVGSWTFVNTAADNLASWTFRKQPKFFDVVTYTGDGVSGRTVAHNLTVAPGFVIVKRTDATAEWACRERIATGYNLLLNSTVAGNDATTTNNGYIGACTATTIALTTGATDANNVNASGGTYVAYLFAHNAGGFGATGTDNVVSCGSFTADGASQAAVTLGYEPQWLLVKISSSTGSWLLVDNMRGLNANLGDQMLRPNSSAAESALGFFKINATGFTWSGADPSASYIYIAIRRGPMKVPTDGTKVYTSASRNGTAGVIPRWTAGFPVDWALRKSDVTTGGGDWQAGDRLRGAVQLKPNLTEAESAASPLYTFDSMTGYSSLGIAGSDTADRSWMFRRAPGFFDEVCYTGTGVATTVAHNLTVVPEWVIVKRRSAANNWAVYAASLGNTNRVFVNQTQASAADSSLWNNTTPTNSVFTVGTAFATNNSGDTYVAYLFASAPGVSKVSSYTGTGTTQVINCGFAAGARFVLIKRTDDVGDWYVWDSARGIVAGNDPYLLLNSTAAEVTTTDYVDTAATGFEISSTAPAAINASGGTYIFLAIA